MDKYEEALERAREIYNAPVATIVTRTFLEQIFPELKESEDERTRKELIHFILYKAGQLLDEETEHKFVVYLEKQKEQKPSELSEEEESQIWQIANNAAKTFDEAFAILTATKKAYDKGKKDAIKEQKPVGWSEEYREEDLRTRFAFYTYKDEDSVLYLSNVFVEEASRNKGFGTKILQAAEKAAEAIGAITICLKVKQDSPANAWYRKHGYGYMTFEDGYDWLEKTLEYLKLTKQEWSEEDGLARDFLLKQTEQYIKVLESIKTEKYIGAKGLIDVASELSDWQSARSFILSLQPHWKPSEEQMAVLLRTEGLVRANNYPENAKILASLYEQLKKL